LKAGGILVYSTCSFDEQQNEKIVADFLQKNENA
jgi:16S rRNA C967 or C1407 C5-methylase (RsmB/RsmF family)